MRVRGLAAVLVALVLVPSAFAGGPSMLVGADEDGPRQPDLAVAKAKMDLARAAGFDSIRITSIWSPGQTSPSDAELLVLGNAVTAAGLAGIKAIVVVTPFGSSTAPTTADAQTQLAQYAASIAGSLPSVNDVIVGKRAELEPVLDAAGLQLLATTYDALKAVLTTPLD